MMEKIKEKKLKSINVFFDTEFTNIHPLVTPMLISIALVGEDGREFYAELTDTYQAYDCSDFVKLNVLPLLTWSQGDQEFTMLEAKCASKIQEFIEFYGDAEVILRSDAPGYDWPLIAEMFQFYGCWPRNLRRKCGTIGFDDPKLWHRYNSGIEEFWKGKADRQHHALEDARSIRFAWKYAIKRGLRR